MTVQKEWLAEVVARSSTFDERMRNGHLVPHLEADEREIDRRLERWRERAAKGDARLFGEVLALRGLDLQSARRGLGRARLSDSSRLPGWTDTLKQCLDTARSDAGSQPLRRFQDAAEPVPFEQILTPFVETGAQLLRDRAGTAYSRLEGLAHVKSERMLLGWLAGPCSAALMLEFSLFRMAGKSFGTSVAGASADSELYDGFVRKMLSGGLAAFFAEYSVLARAVATLVDHWVSATGEFLIRLDADYERLRDIFGAQNEPGRVADIKAGLSDPHNGGRTVLALKFNSGLKVVYKPKSLAPEHSFGKLLDWVNGRGAGLRLRAPKVLAGAQYGWVEYLDYAPCASELELANFYRRSGMLLALFHVLDATDVHSENLIAVGEFPMLVDAETLITPPLRPIGAGEARGWSEVRAAVHLDDSVLKTGMLPNWRRDGMGINYDLSALGGVGGEEIDTPVWVGAQTDGMERQISKAIIQRNRNVPFQPDQRAEPTRFREEVAAGFEELYAILSENSDALLLPDSPFALLAKAPMRLVFRETQTYFNILKKSLDPSVMRDGADRSVDLEVLSRILCISNPHSKHFPLVEAERRSIENLDIPAFTLSPADRSLSSGNELIAQEYFSQSGYERVLANVRALSPERCAAQCAVIRGSFYAKALNSRAMGSVSTDRTVVEALADTGDARSAAIEIGQLLETTAIRGEDGSASWIGIMYRPQMDVFRYLPLAEDLLDGQAGVAAFLAGLAKVDAKAFTELAMGATLPLRRFVESALDDGGWKKVRDGKLEAALLIYPFVRMAQFLNDQSLIDLARRATGLVTADFLELDRNTGISKAIPGILMGLLALSGVAEDASVLERAILCGDHLLKQSVQIVGGNAALARLHAGTRLDRFKGTAGTDLADEWVGLGLFDSLTSGLMASDSLDGGNFGSIELAIEAAERLGRPALLTAAQRLAMEATTRAKTNGGYLIYPGIPQSAPCFGFMRGIAGIGYTLLRLHAPDLPSILLWN